MAHAVPPTAVQRFYAETDGTCQPCPSNCVKCPNGLCTQCDPVRSLALGPLGYVRPLATSALTSKLGPMIVAQLPQPCLHHAGLLRHWRWNLRQLLLCHAELPAVQQRNDLHPVQHRVHRRHLQPVRHGVQALWRQPVHSERRVLHSPPYWRHLCPRWHLLRRWCDLLLHWGKTARGTGAVWQFVLVNSCPWGLQEEGTRSLPKMCVCACVAGHFQQRVSWHVRGRQPRQMPDMLRRRALQGGPDLRNHHQHVLCVSRLLHRAGQHEQGDEHCRGGG